MSYYAFEILTFFLSDGRAKGVAVEARDFVRLGRKMPLDVVDFIVSLSEIYL